HRSITKTIQHFGGHIAKHNNHMYVVFFTTCTNAVLCALKIKYNFKYIGQRVDSNHQHLGIGISTESTGQATQLCEVVPRPIVITTSVKKGYEQENNHAKIDPDQIRTLKPKEEEILAQVMAFSQTHWNDSRFTHKALCAELGFGRTQLYRHLKKLTGKSPTAFMREYRLHKALHLLHRQFGTIGQVAHETGFNSATYFTKCFVNTYGMLPSKYAQLNLQV
ncbi:MAG: helix-turn-helix domain-containing protein, partial [Maribacter sp.]|uniref:helix-turn-helix domain-containing protein n=1 Tax=Maribacter sp. TaxID=1897614 RepID=UPI003C7215EB